MKRIAFILLISLCSNITFSQCKICVDIDTIMTQLNVSNEDLAAYTSTSEWYISQVRKGRMGIRVRMAEMMAERLHSYTYLDENGYTRMSKPSSVLLIYSHHNNQHFFWEIHEEVKRGLINRIKRIDHPDKAQKLSIGFTLKVVTEDDTNGLYVTNGRSHRIITNKRKKA